MPVLLAQFGQSAFGDKASGGDHPDPVGHSFGDFKNMRGHDHCAAGANAISEQSLDVARRNRVEPGERFVQNDQARVMYQGSRQRDLLAHAFGETLAALVEMRLSSEREQQFVSGRFGNRGIDCP